MIVFRALLASVSVFWVLGNPLIEGENTIILEVNKPRLTYTYD